MGRFLFIKHKRPEGLKCAAPQSLILPPHQKSVKGAVGGRGSHYPLLCRSAMQSTPQTHPLSLRLDLHQALSLTGRLHRYLCFGGWLVGVVTSGFPKLRVFTTTAVKIVLFRATHMSPLQRFMKPPNIFYTLSLLGSGKHGEAHFVASRRAPLTQLHTPLEGVLSVYLRVDKPSLSVTLPHFPPTRLLGVYVVGNWVASWATMTNGGWAYTVRDICF